jgi:putative ABC transport system substrate-binding protein
MKRREFIASLGGASAAAFAPAFSRAQPSKLARVGILDTTAPGEYTDRNYWSAFRAEMTALGYHESGNVAFHPRYAYNDLTKLPALIEELIRVPVDVIVAQSTPTAQAAKSVTGGCLSW